jgi:cysteinyl-tRNA synthetase
MDEDFNTPRALAAVFDLATALNKAADAVTQSAPRAPAGAELAAGARMLRRLAGVLGLRLTASMSPEQRAALRRLVEELAREQPALFDPAHPLFDRLAAPGNAVSGEELIAFIAEGRMRARQRKDWATGDAIRSRLHGLGILLEDTPTGFTWRLR